MASPVRPELVSERGHTGRQGCMQDTEVVGTVEISTKSKDHGHKAIGTLRAGFEMAMDVSDVHFPILSVGEHLTRAAFRVRVIGRDRHEARTRIETLCRDALRPFDRPDPPFAAAVKLEVEAPSD
jgi:hypothetical protein